MRKMRMIDGDAVLADIHNAMCADCQDECAACQWRDAIKLIENAPTVGSWISVKDRLPESMANKVLVWLKHNDLVGYIGFGHYEKYKGQEIWYDLEHSEAFSVRGYTVTHWMPLPESPKDEET